MRTRATRILGLGHRPVARPHRRARPGRVARRRQPEGRRPAALPARAHRLAGDVRVVRGHQPGQRPLPLAPHPVPLLGPHRRRLGRDRRGVPRPDPAHRVDLGPDDLGRVVDLGRPPDHHRRAVRPLPRLPGRAPGGRPTPRWRPSGPPSWPSPPSSTSPSSTSRWSGGARSTSRPASSTSPACSTPRSRASCWSPCCWRSSPSPSSTPGCWSTASAWRGWRTGPPTAHGAGPGRAPRRGDAWPTPTPAPTPAAGAAAPADRLRGHPGADLMTHAAYIFAGYGLTTAILAGYAAWVITRRRSLARTLGLDDGARSAARVTRRLWLAAVVVLGALGFLVYQGLGNATLYFRTADEAVAQRETLGDRRFRIEGDVVDPVTGAGRRRVLPDRVQRRRGAGHPQGRPARAVPARHPGGARGPVPGGRLRQRPHPGQALRDLRGREPGSGDDLRPRGRAPQP